MTNAKANRGKNLTVLSFDTAMDWEKWLASNYDTSTGVWLKISKKDVAQFSLTYAEALNVALCYGWIDGQKKSGDESAWFQKFTPRGSRSGWSKKNTEHVSRLIKAGRMKPSGVAAVEAAKIDGRWQSAYDSQRASKIPEDFLEALAQDKKAQVFFETLDKANRYSIAYRLQTAKKPETRAKRMQAILEMMSNGKKFHP